MGIKYELAPDLQKIINEIAVLLYPHVRINSVVCIRSFGSSSRGTIARCHALGKAMQLALDRKGFYVIEVINKRFDKLKEEDKIKTLIHELMHIPKSFGGGFKYHDYVCEKNVEREFQKYVNLKKKESFVNSILRGEGIDSARKISENLNEKKEKRSWWF